KIPINFGHGASRSTMNPMQRTFFYAIPIAIVTLGLTLAQTGSAPRLTSDAIKDLPVRNILGTFSSGRIADIAVNPKNRSIWYVATASGGLWKTTNRGLSFTPIFDDGGSYSLDCVTLDP